MIIPGYVYSPRAGVPGGAYSIRPYTGTRTNKPTGPQAPTNQRFNRAARPPTTIRIMDSRTNYKNMLLVLLLVVAGLAGAMMPQQAAAKHKPPTPTVLSLSTKKVNAGYNGGEYKVTLSCNHALRITRVDRPSWIEIGIPTTKQMFYAKKTIMITVRPNRSDKRECEIVIRTTLGSVSLKVTQEAGEKVVFTVHPSKLEVEANGGEVDVRVDCTERFSSRNPILPDWMDKSDGMVLTNAGKSAYYKFIFRPNKGYTRVGVIIFPTSEGDVPLDVTQKAAGTKPKDPEKAVFTLEPKELDAGPMRDDYEVTLSCNIPYHINDSNMPDWLDVSRNSGGLEAIQKTRIAVYPNTGGKREGVITFKTNAGEVTLKVTQAGGSDPKSFITLAPKELKVEAEGGAHKVTLSSKQNFDFNKFVIMPSWIRMGKISSGPNSYSFTLEFKPNTGPERTADVVFSICQGEIKLKVTQAGGAKPNPPSPIRTEPDELTLNANGTSQYLQVRANGSWTVSASENWVTAPKSGAGDEKINVGAKPNNSSKERTAKLTFKLNNGKGEITVTIKQGASIRPQSLISSAAKRLNLKKDVGTQLVDVNVGSSNSDIQPSVGKDVADWLKVSFEKGTNRIKVETQKSTGYKKRVGLVKVILNENGQQIEDEFYVVQDPETKPAVAVSGISLNPASMTMGGGGGTVGFNVYAGKGWTISGSPEWMHPDATRGSGTRLVIVRFDRNESGAERTGKLTVKSDDGKAERTFTLTQRAGQRKPSRPSDDGTYDYDLALNPEEITVGPSEGSSGTISVVTGRLWAGSTTEDWIRLESAVGRGNGTFTFRLAANPSKEMRHGTITVRTQQGMDELKVTIHQQGNDGSVIPAGPVKVTDVSLDPGVLTINGDMKSTLISAAVYPEEARNKSLLWMSSNPAVATVQVTGTSAVAAALSDRPQLRFAAAADDYALVTFVGKGKAVITAAASDGSGIVARCEVNVLSTVANTVPYAPQAKVYTVGPTLYLSLPTAETVQVYTLAGTLYRTWQVPAGDTSLTLPLGTYIIKVGQLTEKVVVR